MVAFLTSALAPMPLYPEYPEIGNPLGVAALTNGPLTAAFPVGVLLILVGALMAGAGSLLSRFRRAHGLERLQLRWLAWGAALAAVALLVAYCLVVEGDGVVLQAAVGSCVALLPLATGRRSCGIGCTTWTASSAAPWPTGCSRCCWASGMPG